MDNSDNHEKKDDSLSSSPSENSPNPQEKDEVKLSSKIETPESERKTDDSENQADKNKTQGERLSLESVKEREVNPNTDEILAEEKSIDPVFDGTETTEIGTQASLAWPEKAVALKKFVKEKGAVAVTTVLRRLSGKKDEESDFHNKDEKNDINYIEESGVKEEKPTWNPLNFMKIGREKEEEAKLEILSEQPTMKGRIVIYTRLGCQECKTVRSFMHRKRLSFVEINIDVFPSRKLELEKNTRSSVVPKVYFNDLLIGGPSELSEMEESGLLDEKIIEVLNEEPSTVAPLPPLPGEDDESGSGKIDELASIVRKMKESVIPKDRFYKMRRFSNCFPGSEAVDFLSEDQYLERDEAIEFGRKLASKHFFRHITDENIFEDGAHLYRFLEQDPSVMAQCYNIPRGTLDVKPKPVTEIASRLRLVSYSIFEAYVSEDGKHVDYRTIHGCEEFKRYLRIIEELQRVELEELSREEKLAFFINLYNMMAIHVILTWGHPTGALARRKFFGDFKYVIGGYPYSLSAIQNGVLRGNQRPPYTLTKPFGPRDRRSQVALLYAEPLVHFALVCGTRSGPALRCYSPGNIDKELMDSARCFMRNGGLVLDAEAKVASASKILHWYNVDFGKNETQVLKHAANYLEPVMSEQLMELLANTQLKVTYQPYDWGLNI